MKKNLADFRRACLLIFKIMQEKRSKLPFITNRSNYHKYSSERFFSSRRQKMSTKDFLHFLYLVRPRPQNSRFFFSQNRQSLTHARASYARRVCAREKKVSPVSLFVFSFCLTVHAYLNLRTNTDCLQTRSDHCLKSYKCA